MSLSESLIYITTVDILWLIVFSNLLNKDAITFVQVSTPGGLFSTKNLSSGSLRFAAALLSFPLSRHVTTWNSSP